VIDWQALSDEDLHEQAAAANTEVRRRSVLASVPEQMAALNARFLAAEGAEPGQPWRQPQGAHDAFPKGWIATHDGRTWVSLLDANVWEPPTNWREQTGPGQYRPWSPPTGAHDAYAAGDRVTHAGHLWQSLVDANVWEPAEGPLWADLGPWPRTKE
jgi:hypothetical protein